MKVLSNRYSGGYSVGDHLFPFRTEKLSPTAPMVLHTRGRVGRRQLFYKPLSTDLLREAFFVLFFLRRVFTWGNAFFLRDDASPPGEDAMPPGEDAILQLGNKKMYSEVIKIMHEYGYMM